MTETVPRLALGPVLYYWSRDDLQAFYRDAADWPVDCVYLGETVCSKRRTFGTDDWLETAARLSDAGKQVVLSTLALIEAESELKTLRRLCGNGRFLVEANDLGAVRLLLEADVPFVAGPLLNVYNPRTLAVLARPLRLDPQRIHAEAAARALQRVLAASLAEGELDFMQGRRLSLRVTDAGFTLSLRGAVGGFAADRSVAPVDLAIEGTAYDYLLLISGREDPDTLFFRRRLRMSGDTALGVHLKNFLAACDPEALPWVGRLRPALERGLRLIERLHS
jgi:predicted lipid carrier protein YhbT